MKVMYIVSEMTNLTYNPLDGSATYIYNNLNKLLSNFEEWYIDVNHIVVDSRGFLYKMMFKDNKIALNCIDNSGQYFDVFSKWLIEYFKDGLEIDIDNRDIIDIISGNAQYDNFFK